MGLHFALSNDNLRHYVAAGEGLELPVEGVRAGAVTVEDVAAFARYDCVRRFLLFYFFDLTRIVRTHRCRLTEKKKRRAASRSFSRLLSLVDFRFPFLCFRREYISGERYLSGRRAAPTPPGASSGRARHRVRPRV